MDVKKIVEYIKDHIGDEKSFVFGVMGKKGPEVIVLKGEEKAIIDLIKLMVNDLDKKAVERYLS